MSNDSPPLPAEAWQRARELFERLFETSDPEALLRTERDPAVAALARRLWENDHVASAHGFLAEPLTLVRRLAGPAEPMFQPGQILAGRFTIEQLLGSGGMGEVYLAFDARLHERVAIKTVRRDLASDPAIGQRFLAEVRNARRVSHAHVCRINDLFDDDRTPFFTMRYLEGVRLNDWLAQTPQSLATRRRIALELAQGLAAAHRAGIVHCDFKPANVILTGPPDCPSAVITDFGLARALAAGPASEGGGLAGYSLRGGTRGYVAPEVAAGGAPDQRSDIYAYGKVLAELLPGHRLAAPCAAPDPQDRPAALDRVVRALDGALTRRMLMLGGGVAAAGAASGAYALLYRPRFVLDKPHRIAVNGFRPGEMNRSGVVRDLLMTALRQSPLLVVMPDDRLRAVLRLLKFKPQIPADSVSMLAVAAQQEAIVVDGVLEAAGAGLRLVLQVVPQGAELPSFRVAEQVQDARQVVQLADRAAQRLRLELGERPESVRTAYVPLENVTSASPEAVDLYFRGVREYEASHTEPAVVFFDQALRLDAKFALAYAHRGLALLAHYQAQSALESEQQAFDLRKPLPERERLYIEVRYYNIVADFRSAYDASRRLVTLFPEEAVFQRGAAFDAVRVGRAHDALPYNQRAVELDPNSTNNLSELVVNHCDAGMAAKALELGLAFRRQTPNAPVLDYSIGNAYLVSEDYDNARQAFERMAADPELERWSRLLRCGPLILKGRFEDAVSALRADLAYDIAAGEQKNLQNRRLWLGMLEWMMGAAARAREQAVALTALDPSPVWLLPLRGGGLLALLLGDTALANSVVERLREIEQRWPSTHTHGARAHLEGALWLDQDLARASEILNQALGLWPDCFTLYSVAESQMRARNFEGAASTLDALEQDRGRILRLYIPHLVVLGRIQRARCLARLSRFDESRRIYEQVTRFWSARNASYPLVRAVQSEYRELMTNSTRGEQK
jgi:serine/threonine protein kinase/tetratricopeptide (TPR) repeat protein